MTDAPTLSDGTCVLRAYTDDDQDKVIDWLSGPRSKDRRSTDGGPSSDAEHVDELIGDLKHQRLYIVEVDGERCGMSALDSLGTSGEHGILTLILEDQCYWHQGIGDRAVGLLCILAFEHYKLAEVSVRNIPEAAEAGRVAWENAGFGQRSRLMHLGQVLVNFTLSRDSYMAHEQRVLLIRHAQHALDGEQRANGRASQSLDSVGRAQAEALKLNSLLSGIASCICADGTQATSTAERAFDERHCASVLDEAWLGQDLGEWQGLAVSELSRDADGMLCDPPAGESATVFRKRVMNAFEQIPHGEDAAIVTHGENICCILQTLQKDLLGAPGLRTGSGIKPSSVTELRRGPGGWRVIRISDDRHIRARRATAELSRHTV